MDGASAKMGQSDFSHDSCNSSESFILPASISETAGYGSLQGIQHKFCKLIADFHSSSLFDNVNAL